MNATVITESNFNVISSVLENVYYNAIQSENKQSTERLLIIGHKAIERFIKEYAPTARIEYAFEPKTDGKTTAQIMPYLYTEAYCDGREENETKTGIICNHCYYNIEYCILFENVYYKLYRQNHNNPALLYYLNERIDYNFLPSNWENNNPIPQRIGVITDKKIKVWADYLLNKSFAANVNRESKKKEVQSFLNRVYKIDISGLSKYDYQITEKSGYIIRNGLKFSYSIDSNLYIDTKIEVNTRIGDRDKIDIFEKMTKGVY